VGSSIRGAAAMGITAVAGVAAVVCGSRASRGGRADEASAGWWLASTVILFVPLLALVCPLG
jgi:hypothetical protein